MLNVYFVILHYQNIDDTINCINSIKKLNKDDTINLKMVVVDNKSPNNTGIELQNKYNEDKHVEVILLDENYGFSKANNIGYQYCKKNFADIILMSNNDILIEDEEFLIKLKNINNQNEIYQIICPDIINFNGNSQNPMRDYPMTIRSAYKNVLYKYLCAFLMKIPVLNNIFYNIEKKRELKWLKQYYLINKQYNTKDFFVPFGAFIIYTKKWIEEENEAFPSKTFMYAEEDILSVYIKNKGYKMLYDANLKIKHLEGRSVDSQSKDKCKNYAFKCINQAKSIKEYIVFSKKVRKN